MTSADRRLFVLGSYVSAFTLRVPRQPVAGETLLGKDFDWGPGGKGFNQAVAAARLGADVELLVAIGNDVFGELALKTLEGERVATPQLLKCDDIHSGVGFVTLTESGENTIVLDPGANQRITPAQVYAARDRISAASMMLLQQEIPSDSVACAIRLAFELGVRTILNPAPARPVDPSLFPLIDIITPNHTEARLLLGLAPDDGTPSSELAHRLQDMGVRSVIMTLGRDGVIVVDSAGEVHLPALRLNPVDTTGAGDAFNAALAVGLLEGMPLREAAAWAVAAGGYCTQHLGVINGLPTRPQLEQFRSDHAR